MSKRHLVRWKLISTVLIAMISYNVAAQEERVRAGFDNGFYVSSDDDDYLMRVNGRLQTRLYYGHAKKQHHFGFDVPNTRLMFGGHVFDRRFGYQTQLGFDQGKFKLVEYYADLDVLPSALLTTKMKLGHFIAGFSMGDASSPAKLVLSERPLVVKEFGLGSVTGISFYRDKKKPISWDLSLFENAHSDDAQKRLAGASLNIGYNYNQLDPSSEVDFEGGPFRLMASAGGYLRSQIDDWRLIGYAASLGAIAKFNHVSINGGAYAGVPESAGAQSITKKDTKLGGFAQAGYLFNKRYSLGARYGLVNANWGGPLHHEILAGVAMYIYGHNLKVQLDGGTYIRDSNFTPAVQAQFQMAF